MNRRTTDAGGDPKGFPKPLGSGEDSALTVRQAEHFRGRVRVPGDKSISHRAVMFGALADGVSRIEGFLSSGDCMATVGCMRALGVETLAVTADISERSDVDRFFDEIVRVFGTVDLLVNNAAFMRRTHFYDVDRALFEQSVAANIVGTYACSSHAAKIMRCAAAGAARGGSIVHISSVGGFRAHWNGLPYDATKGAIDAMTRAMAIELAEYGIRVNAVAPGATRTDRSPAPDSEHAARIRLRVPLGRFGSTVEIGNAVAFLASEEAAYITGQVLYVDGGVTAQLDPRTHPT